MTKLRSHVVGKKQSRMPQSIMLTMAISSQGLTSKPIFMVHVKNFTGLVHVEEAPFGVNTDTTANAEFWIYNRENPDSVLAAWTRYYEVLDPHGPPCPL